jgi:thymidylate synthase
VPVGSVGPSPRPLWDTRDHTSHMNTDNDFAALNGREAVWLACREIMRRGDNHSPRGQRTKELAFARITIADPSDIVADGITRKGLLPAIGYGEGLQCVAGISAPGLMADISSGFPKPSSRWSDDVPTYGARLYEHDQIGTVAEKLASDPDSRQAVALVWRPDDMVAGQAHNLCTIALQFLNRDGALHMAAFMRSNDAWHGLPYDLQQFATIQASLAVALDLDVGRYVHHATSLHLYERHWEAADALAWDGMRKHKDRPLAVGRSGDDWPTIRERAAKLLRGEALDSFVTHSEHLYIEALAKYVYKEDACS